MDRLISELVNYGLKQNLVHINDKIYVVNQLLELFGKTEFHWYDVTPRPLDKILSDMNDYAIAHGFIEDTITNRDMFDTKIMGLLTPVPSVVRKIFQKKYMDGPKEATDFYYQFSKDTNYIRTERVAKAATQQKSGYPKCLLCQENEGYAGHISHPARQNHRIIPIQLAGQDYYLQYSPYVYYNEHCIVFNTEHVPMKIDENVFVKLLDFVKQFPHNTITPIARKKDDLYEMDLVLRNNITTEESPWGVYHPEERYHHIKKENIGLIEVMGLAVLPARLKKEMDLVSHAIIEGKNLRLIEAVSKHADWVEGWKEKYDISSENIKFILQKEIGNVFIKVLECAGVFKRTEEGALAFKRFLSVL